MAVVNGYLSLSGVGGYINASVSSDLRSNDTSWTGWPPVSAEVSLSVVSAVARNAVAQPRYVVNGYLGSSYFNDYYNRVHLLPSKIDLGQISSSQTRSFEVWNAYINQSLTLTDIAEAQAFGITLTGPGALPFTFTPNMSTVWTANVLASGPPDINAAFQFNFTGLSWTPTEYVVGSRAIVQSNIPEVPVNETWEWFTDIKIAFDGSEQRIALRAVPRRSLDTTLKFESEDELREEYKILQSANGHLFVPYFQYNTTTTADAAIGDTVLAFDTSCLDLRDGDYVLLIQNGGATLVQLDTVGTSSATLKVPLTQAVVKKTILCAIYASILPNNLSLHRPATNTTGELQINSSAMFPRSSHQRPGSTATMIQLDGYSILERRPLADSDIEYAFDTGQDELDAKTGLFDVDTQWNFTKSETTLQFRCRRLGINECSGLTGPEEMDYWRLFTDEMKGSQGTFLHSTYRDDQLVVGAVGAGATALTFAGSSYNDIFFAMEPFIYLAITTDAGIHYTKVQTTSKDGQGNSVANFLPALPSGAGWNNIQTVSYLLKLRIVNDQVQLQHDAYNTVFNFRVRTVDQ